MQRDDYIALLADRIRKVNPQKASGLVQYGPDEYEQASIEAMAQAFQAGVNSMSVPTPMRLPCPSCGAIHIDEGEFATKRHHTHACQECGEVWRPAVVHTVGVRFLPGFKNL